MTTSPTVDEGHDESGEQLAFYVPAVPKLSSRPGRVERFLQQLHEPTWL